MYTYIYKYIWLLHMHLEEAPGSLLIQLKLCARRQQPTTGHVIFCHTHFWRHFVTFVHIPYTGHVTPGRHFAALHASRRGLR